MLSIARLEAGIDSSQWTETPIGGLANELCELYEAVAEEEDNLEFVADIQDNPVSGDNQPTRQCNQVHSPSGCGLP